MAKTINRQPFSVALPSSSEAKDYFFSHSNWKGVSDDKNFLTADQETFESSMNVYSDSEGLLRSRPAIKKSSNRPSEIQNFWVFGKYILYLVRGNYVDGPDDDSEADHYRYDLVLTDFSNTPKLDTAEAEGFDGFDDTNVKPVLVENKIFIFAKDSFRYIDLLRFDFAEAYDFIYAPSTTVTSLATTSKVEDVNILTNAEVITYLYEEGFPPDLLIGKELSFTILGVSYTATFNRYTTLLLYDKLDIYLTSGSVLCEIFARDGYDSIAILDPSSRQFLYSQNGESWDLAKTVPEPQGPITELSFTLDGNEVYYSDTIHYDDNYGERDVKQVWMVSVNKSIVGGILDYRFNSFTDIFAYLGISYLELKLAFFTTYNKGVSIHRRLVQGNPSEDKFIKFDGALYEVYDIPADFSNIYEVFEFANYDSLYGRSDVVLMHSHNKLTLSKFNGVIYDRQLVTISVTISNVKCVYENSELFIFGYDYELQKVVKYSCSGSTISEVSRGPNVADYYVLRDGVTVVSDLGIWNSSLNYDVENPDNSGILFLESQKNQGDQPVTRILGAGNYYYYTMDLDGHSDNSIYSNKVSSIPLKETVQGDNSKMNEFATIFSESSRDVEVLSELYAAVSNKLYITESRRSENGDFLWYIPEKTIQQFNSNITGLQSISTNEMAIFLEDEIWYSQKTDAGYTYTKSKLQVGLKDGADVITSYDGTQVIFPTKRGLVALTYQNFVASTDQALTFLSDPIHAQFVDFCSNAVKLLRYQYWILCYKMNDKLAYLFDIRNNSWWPIESFANPTKILDVDNQIVPLINHSLYNVSSADESYFDFDGTNKYGIEWNVKSQKLHLNAVNYYKHISNITLMSVLDSDKVMFFKMKINNYRKKIDTTQIQTGDYRVDAIRTYVKRVSFPKVNEFQYNLFSDELQAPEIRVPLSLSGLTIKYRIGSQVR